jgi:hypothetical protein
MAAKSAKPMTRTKARRLKPNGAIGTTYREIMAALPAKRRAKIKARAAKLIREDLTLQELRKAFALTQADVAASLKTTQNQISRLEQRPDMLLCGYVEAMGGKLDLVATFPGQPPVSLAVLVEAAT